MDPQLTIINHDSITQCDTPRANQENIPVRNNPIVNPAVTPPPGSIHVHNVSLPTPPILKFIAKFSLGGFRVICSDSHINVTYLDTILVIFEDICQVNSKYADMQQKLAYACLCGSTAYDNKIIYDFSSSMFAHLRREYSGAPGGTVVPPEANSDLAKFASLVPKAPSLPLNKYISDRICKYMKPNDETITMAITLLDELLMSYEGKLVITQFNIHRLLTVSILISLKFNEDSFCTNDYYAKVIGISNFELNELEVLFLSHLNFDVWIDRETIETYRQHFERLRHNIQTFIDSSK